MRVNNNTISSNRPVFGSNITRRNTSRPQGMSNAYKVEISNWATKMLAEYDDDLAEFNYDVLSYDKNLKLRSKFHG